MSDVLITPLMGLANPVPENDPGPDYAQNLYNSLNILDGHNHSVGSGNQINTNGLLINADLPFNSDYNATLMRSLRFAPQAAPLALASDLGCLYESGVDLYYNDGNGNQIRMTSGGNVNATSSGISSGTATASFSAGVLVVNSNTNTPANIQAGSILIGNNTPSSNFVTLSAPSALASNYPIVFPSGLPGARSFVSLDSSGNIASYAAVAGGITGSNIASATIGASNMAANSIATASIQNNAVTPAKLSAPNAARDTWTGATTSSSSATLRGAATITVSGLRNIQINLHGPNSDTGAVVSVSWLGAAPTRGVVGIINQTTGATVCSWGLRFTISGGTASTITLEVPLNFSVTLTPADPNYPTAGTYTYSAFIRVDSGANQPTIGIDAGTITVTEL